MRNELKNIERVESYILENMSLTKKAEFEQELNQNTALREQVDQQKLIIQAIRRKGLRKEINKANGNNANLWKGLGGSLLLIIGLLGAFLYFNPGPSKLNIPEIPNSIIDTTQIDSSISEEIDQTFHGLKTFTAPIIQKFVFSTDTGATIEGKDGTLIIVPNNAFIDKNGKTIFHW